MAGIFVSYRREDSAGHAGRLFDRLSEHFGRNRVFRDVDQVRAGDDFVDAIARAVGSCAALLVVIGRDWLTCTDDRGARRLDNPDDFVRLEVETALKRGVLAIPVLVRGATMPRPADLPESLGALSRRQAIELSESRWDFDVQQVIARLEPVVQRAPAKKRVRWAIALGVIAVFSLAGYASRPWWTNSSNTSSQVDGSAVDIPSAASNQSHDSTTKAATDSLRAEGGGALPDSVTRAGRTRRADSVSVTPPPPPPPDPRVNRIAVPALIGMHIDSAETLLARRGFTNIKVFGLGTGTSRFNNVVRQMPGPDAEFPADKEVRIYIEATSSREFVRAPDITGMTLPAALDAYERAGLDAAVIDSATRRVRPNTVWQAMRSGARVPVGAVVTVFVEPPIGPPSLVEVPNVLGMHQKTAHVTLVNAGLKVGRWSSITTGNYKPGLVATTRRVRPGAWVQPGFVVDLSVEAEVDNGSVNNGTRFVEPSGSLELDGNRDRAIDILYFDGNRFRPLGGALLLPITGKTFWYAPKTCFFSEQDVARALSLQDIRVTAGLEMCVRTSAGRVALVRVLQILSDGIEVKYTTWDR